MLLNFRDKGLCAHAIIIYNFSQVKDAALLVLFSNEYHQPSSMLFTQIDGKWYCEDNPGYLSAENFHQINKTLNYISKQDYNQQDREAETREPYTDYVLLLSGLCS